MMGAQDLFLLSIGLSVLGAAAALFLNRTGKLANQVASLAAFAAALASTASGITVMTSGQSFSIVANGGFPFTQFIIRVDQLSAFMVVVISFLALAVSIYSIGYLDEYLKKNPGVLGCLMNLFIASMLMVVSVGDAFYFLIFWEVMTLTSYFLVIYEQDKQSLRAGFLYFLVAHGGTALIMLAFLLLYKQANSFDFAAWRGIAMESKTASLVFVLAFIGFAAKAGAVPLHFWLPEAHSAAPSNVSALLSGVMIKTAIYMIVRVSIEFLGAASWWWGMAVLLVGIVSTVLGPLYAMTQHDIKRLLAFHSVEYIGIILIGVGAGMLGMAIKQPLIVVLGLMAAFYHLLNHAVFKGLLFLGAGSVIYRTHTRNMEELGGLARLMPWTAFLFFVGGIAISAIPPLNGFVSKWFIYQSLFSLSLAGSFVEKLFVPLFAMLLAMAGASTAMCIAKAYGVTFTGMAHSKHAEAPEGVTSLEVPASMLVGKGILAAATLLLGLGAPLVVPSIATAVATSLQQPAVLVSDGSPFLNGTVYPGTIAQGALSTPLVGLFFVVLLLVPVLIVALAGGRAAGSRLDATPWAAGYRYTAQMSAAPRSFGQPIQTLFRFVLPGVSTFEEHGHVHGPTPGKYFKRVSYGVSMGDVWNKYLLQPLAQALDWLSRTIQVMQGGNMRIYVLYIIFMLAILLAAVEFIK